DERHGRDDGLFAHVRLVHHHRIHAHQAVPADAAGVDHRAVPDVAVFLHHAVDVAARVHHAVVLQVGATLEHDAAEVAAHHGAGTDVAAGLHDDVAHQHRARVDIGGRIDDRRHALER